jgi:hypothetical protein
MNLNPASWWSPRSVPYKEEVPSPTLQEKESRPKGTIQDRVDSGELEPVLSRPYEWLQSRCRRKIVRTREGIHRGYKFWPIERELTRADIEDQKREDAYDIPVGAMLYRHYLQDGRIYIVLVKEQLGKKWIECEETLRIEE